MKPYLLIGVITTFALLFSLFVTETRASDVRLIIDDNEITGLLSPPVLRDDRVLIPTRAVIEYMGGTVDWHSYNRQVTVLHGDDVLIMTIDTTSAILNGSQIAMHTAPVILNDSTMIPLRFSAEIFGFEVYWDEYKPAAIVNSPSKNSDEDPKTPTYELPQEPEVNCQQSGMLLPPPPPPPPTSDPTRPLPPVQNNPTSQSSPPNHIIARNVSTSPILTVPHPKTNLTQVLTPDVIGMAAYVIVADSPISEVSYFVISDNRLVVTINNAVNLVRDNIPAHPSAPVSGVRIAQYAPTVSRLAFDVVGPADFTLSLSQDRKSLTIAFAPNVIRNISTRVETGMDSLIIEGDVRPDISICTQGYPNYLTINIENTRMATSGTFSVDANFITQYTTGHRSENGSSYIRLYVGDTWPTFNIAYKNNGVVFMMHQALTGIRYDTAQRELHIARSIGFAMDINKITHADNYLHLQYALTLPTSATMLGRGELSVLDGFINRITVESDASGNARLVFDTDRIITLTVQETPDSYIIRVRLPRETSPFVVVIDPGHGGSNIGAVHNGICEIYLVQSIGDKVMQLVNANPSIRGYMTRHYNTHVYNQRRAEFANELDADLFVSIHANAAQHSPGVINTTANGIETLYAFPVNEQNHNNTFTSRQFSEIVQRHMVTRTGARDRGLVYRPRVIVLRETNMPAALIEVGFLTNPQEAARLATAAYQWQLAYAIYDAIVEAANTFATR